MEGVEQLGLVEDGRMGRRKQDVDWEWGRIWVFRPDKQRDRRWMPVWVGWLDGQTADSRVGSDRRWRRRVVEQEWHQTLSSVRSCWPP